MADKLVFKRGLNLDAITILNAVDEAERNRLRELEDDALRRTRALEDDHQLRPHSWELVGHFPEKGFSRARVDAAYAPGYDHIELHSHDVDTGEAALTLLRKARGQ